MAHTAAQNSAFLRLSSMTCRFPLVVAKSDILPINVPIACLQLSDQRAWGYLPTPKRRYEVYIVGKRGKEQTIFPELSEHCTELPQVFPQKYVRRRFVIMLANTFRPAATDVIPYIRVMFLRVSAFNILCASYRPLERWQSVDSWLPVRSLMAAVPCGHRTDRQKRTKDSYEYMHHRVRGLKLLMGTTEIPPSSFTLRLLKSNFSS